MCRFMFRWVSFLSTNHYPRNPIVVFRLYSHSASVMSGRHAGVQAILREEFMPKAVYIHCYVHRLNLVISDVCTSVSYVSEFYSIVRKIYTYFTASAVTNKCFQQAQSQLKLSRKLSNRNPIHLSQF